MLRQIRPLVFLLLPLSAPGVAYADPRFDEAPTFWAAGAQITFSTVVADPAWGEIDGVRLHFPAAAHTGRFARLEVTLDEEWVCDLPANATEAVVEYQTLRGIWRIQPTLEDGRPVGEPLVLQIAPEAVGVASLHDDADAVGGLLGHAMNDPELRTLFEGLPVDSPFADLDEYDGLDSLGGLEGAGGLIGMGGFGRAGAVAPPSASGGTGTVGLGSLGGSGSAAPAGRFEIDLHQTTVGGPTPPDPDDLVDELHRALRAAAPCVRGALEGRPAVVTVALVAPPRVPLEVDTTVAAPPGEPALDATVASAARTCIATELPAASFPEAGLGWQATLSAAWRVR